MQKIPTPPSVRSLVLACLVGLTACDAPESRQVPLAPELASLAGASLLECPSSEPILSERLLGAVGGLLSAAGTLVYVPASAISGPVQIGIELPASRYMLVDLTANGYEHWQFEAPVTVSIDYSRCRVGLLAPPMRVWHVDPATGAMLEPMGGVDNRLLRRVTFTTDHFSGYAIAN